MQKRTITGVNVRLTKEQREELIEREERKKNARDEKHSGGFTRIYPEEGTEKYQKFIAMGYQMFQDWTGANISRVRKPEPKEQPRPRKLETMKTRRVNTVAPAKMMNPLT